MMSSVIVMRRRRVTLPRSVDCHIPLLYLRTFGDINPAAFTRGREKVVL